MECRATGMGQTLEDFRDQNKELSQINSGENRTISYSDARENLTESLGFEILILNTKGSLKARSILIYGWTKTSTDIESNAYNFQL